MSKAHFINYIWKNLERKNIRLRRDEILRLKFLKNEYNYVILRSILKTRYLKPTIRFYSYNLLIKKNAFIGR